MMVTGQGKVDLRSRYVHSVKDSHLSEGRLKSPSSAETCYKFTQLTVLQFIVRRRSIYDNYHPFKIYQFKNKSG